MEHEPVKTQPHWKRIGGDLYIYIYIYICIFYIFMHIYVY